jgi:hypothetical protein
MFGMAEKNLDHEYMEAEYMNSEYFSEDLEPSHPEAFYLALRNALDQLKHQPVEAPVLH